MGPLKVLKICPGVVTLEINCYITSMRSLPKSRQILKATGYWKQDKNNFGNDRKQRFGHVDQKGDAIFDIKHWAP